MHKRTPIKLLSLLIALCLLLTSLPGSAVEAKAVEAEATENTVFQLDADCQILDYVHEEVFNQNDHVSRLKEEETLDTYVFLNSDGTKTVYYMNDAVKYRDASGTVREKNIDLIASLNGYSTTQNDVQLHIPNNVTNGVQLSYAGYDVSIVPQGGSNRLPSQRNGNSVAYPNYFGSGTALIYTPTLNGVKEDILLAQYNGVSDFTFLLNTDGLNLYHTPEDRYYLALTEDAEMKIWLGNIEIFDAETKPSMGTMTVETVNAGQQYRLTISADVDFLTDPETVYPVTIDPTITVSDNTYGASAIEDAPIYEGYPTSNFGTYQYDRVGYAGSPYGRGRTVVRLKGLYDDTGYAASYAVDVTDVKFYIADASGTASATVNLYPLTSDSTWTESNITWSSVGSYTSTASASAGLAYGAYACFDITSLAKAWKDGTYNYNCGFILVAENETSVDKALYSSEHSTTNMRPYAVATYTLHTGSITPSIDVDIGYTHQLTVTGMTGTVIWESSNPSVATVNSIGIVTGVDIGTATISARTAENSAVYCTVYVTIPDGVYYIKNAASNNYLAVTDGGISDNTRTELATKTTADPERLSQLWKIKYVHFGCYSIRPMHKLDSGLNVTSGYADIDTIGTADTYSSIPNSSLWKIERTSTGYYFRNNASYNSVLYPAGGSTSSGATVVATTYSASGTAFHWTMERVTSGVNGILIYDLRVNEAISTARGVMPGQTLSPSQLDIAAVGYTSDSDITQNIRWTSSNQSVATVNSSTGAVTGISNGSATITAIYDTPGGSSPSKSYSVVVSPLPISGYELDYVPNFWNSSPIIDRTNCYSYALNNYNYHMNPGYHSIGRINKYDINAENLITCINADAQELGFTFEEIGATEICPKNTYKVALVCDPGNDYHWYRQNSDGSWSHKRGLTQVIDYDASPNTIYNPETANRSYSSANYSVFVGFYYVSPLF